VIAGSWTPTPLGEVISHRNTFVTIDDRQAYQRCRVQLNARGIVLRDRVLGVEIKTKNQQVCQTGDFLVAEIDAKLGGFGIVPESLNGAIVSSHYFLFQIDESRLRRAFLDFCIRTPQFQEQVLARGSTNYAAIRPRHVLEYTIPLPDMDEQDLIVAKLDAIAARAIEAQLLCRKIEEERHAYITSLHFALARGRSVEVSSFLRLDEDLAVIEPVAEYPQIGIRSFGKGIFGKAAVRGTDTTYRHFNRVRAGQLILSQVKGWEGAVGVCPSELDGCFASPEYRTFTCVEGECCPTYLSAIAATDWFHRLLADATRGQGARRERTRPELFLKIMLPMPRIAVQRRASQAFLRLDGVPDSLRSMEQELVALMPAVLDRAFSGALS